MRHDICYRDNDTKEGKHACDDEMLKEQDVLEPKGIRGKIARKLVRTITGTKRKLSWGIEWSNELVDELHKPRRVFASGTGVIWTADLVDMQSFSKSNKCFKNIPMIIDVFSKYGRAIPLKTKNRCGSFLLHCHFYILPIQKLNTSISNIIAANQLHHLIDDINLYLYGHHSLRIYENRHILISTIIFIKEQEGFPDTNQSINVHLLCFPSPFPSGLQ